MKPAKIIALTGLLSLFTFACTRQNEEALALGSSLPACDTSNMSYAINIEPILENNCVSCHNATQSNDGVILTDYNDVIAQINNGNLLNVIQHSPGYPQMPYLQPQLPACTINEIIDWINRGSLNN